MRIEAYNQVQQMYRSQRVNKNQKTAKATFADQVQISTSKVANNINYNIIRNSKLFNY